MEKICRWSVSAAVVMVIFAISYALAGDEYQLNAISHGVIAVFFLLAYIAAKLSE